MKPNSSKDEYGTLYDAITDFGMKHISSLPQEVIDAMDVVANYCGDISQGREYEAPQPTTKPSTDGMLAGAGITPGDTYQYYENLEHDYGFSVKEMDGIRKAVAEQVTAAHIQEVNDLLSAIGPATNDDELHVHAMLEDRLAQLSHQSEKEGSMNTYSFEFRPVVDANRQLRRRLRRLFCRHNWFWEYGSFDKVRRCSKCGKGGTVMPK